VIRGHVSTIAARAAKVHVWSSTPSAARLCQACRSHGSSGHHLPLRCPEYRANSLPLFDVLGKWLTVRGYVMMEITSDPERLERGKKFIDEGLAEGSFKPIIARTFPLEGIVGAHRYWNRTSRSVRLWSPSSCNTFIQRFRELQSLMVSVFVVRAGRGRAR